MSLKIDKVQLEIIMKSDTTRAEIIKLEDQAKSLRKEMGKLKNNPAELAKASAEYDKVTNRIKELKNSIHLTGMTMRELQEKSKLLQMQLRNLTPGSEKYQQFDAELKQVNARMKELRGQASQTQSGLSNLANGFNKYFALATSFIAGITGASLAFRKLAEDVAHMDDVYSDVMKTTNLSKEQVLELNESFKKMDTRTSRESLNMLARDAGKLGKESTKDILDFVEAGNQINVALGEDLGEDAIKSIGKMVGVFQRSTKELQGIGLKEQMLAVASAINTLGASSSADEGYLVAFAGRLGGVAKQAGISMDAILGFGSALDQDMQQVEMAATALQNFIMKLMADPAKFAKLAGLEVKGFTKLLSEDANAAIKQVLTAMNEKGGFQALIPMFEGMGLEGARAVGVLSSMAGSIDKIDEAQRIANKSISEGTSVTKEYNIKNENLAARLDKAKKAFQETALELGARLNPVLLNSTKAITYLTKGLVYLIENWNTVSKLLLIITGYTIAYNAQMLLNNILLKEGLGLKVKNLILKAKDAIVLETLILKESIHAATIGKTTLASKAAAIAQTIWNTTIKANPWGFAIGILTTLAAAIYLITSRTKDAITAQKENARITVEANNSVFEETAHLNALISILKDSKRSYNERKSALLEIQKIVPEYHGSLTKEGTLINDNSAALDTYIRKLKLSAQVQLATSSLASAEQERTKFIEDNKAAFIEITKMRMKASELIYSGKYDNMDNALSAAGVGAGFRGLIDRLDEINKKVKLYDDLVNQYSIDLNKINASTLPTGPKNGDLSPDGLSVWRNGKWVLKNAGGSGIPDKDPYGTALKLKEDAYKESQLELIEQRRKGELTEEMYNKIALQTQLSFLEEKKKLQEKFKKDTIDTEIEISNQKTKIGQDADKFALESLKVQQEAGLKALESGEITKQKVLQEALNRGIITEREYNLEIKKLAVELNAAKLALAQASLEALKKVDFKDKETQKKALEDALAEIARLQEALLNAQGDVAKDVAKGVEKATQTVAERMKSIFGDTFGDIGTMFTSFTENLEKLKNGDLKTWKDWGISIGEIVQTSLAVATQFNDKYFQYKTSALEADKQRELTNAGDSAEQREKINKEYAQKELDLKKKQSSADTVLSVAKAIASGAVAIIKALELGPIAGPIAATLIGGMTSLEIGTIIKQNAAIQATTLDSSTTGNTATATGARVVSQAADGRYDVIGEKDRKLYQNVRYAGIASTGLVTRPTLMGETGKELVISAPDLRRLNMKAPWFNSFVFRNTVGQRADGNYTAIADAGGISTYNNAVMGALVTVLNKNNELLEYLAENRIEAYTLLSEFEKKRALMDRSKLKGSLR